MNQTHQSLLTCLLCLLLLASNRAAIAAVDNDMAGDWRLLAGDSTNKVEVLWHIEASGRYTRQINGFRSETGTLDASGGHWSLHADSGRADQGSYRLSGGSLTLTDSQGQNVEWNRPPAPLPVQTASTAQPAIGAAPTTIPGQEPGPRRRRLPSGLPQQVSSSAPAILGGIVGIAAATLGGRYVPGDLRNVARAVDTLSQPPTYTGGGPVYGGQPPAQYSQQPVQYAQPPVNAPPAPTPVMATPIMPATPTTAAQTASSPQAAANGQQAYVSTSVRAALSSGSGLSSQIKAPVEVPIDVNKPIKDKWALVIGISKFQDPTISLKYASKDAKDFRDFLVSEGNFAADHVHMLTDEQATRENILAEIGDRWLPHVANPDDLVLIFISSHGSPSKADVCGTNYLVAHNTDKASLYATGIPMQELSKVIKDRVHSNRVVVLLDACHSGAAEPESKGVFRQSNFDAQEVSQGCGQLVICSSEPAQVSWESKNYSNGVFTHHLILGLRSSGSKTRLGSAFEFMKEHVQEEVLKDRGELQTPVLKSRWQGSDVLICNPPTKPRKVGEPAK